MKPDQREVIIPLRRLRSSDGVLTEKNVWPLRARVPLCFSFYPTRFIVCRKSPISSATRHLSSLFPIVDDHCTGWPARFVVGVSQSKNKWREERHSFLYLSLSLSLSLSREKHCLSVCVRQSDESALIWLNVAQSWQFTPSESQLQTSRRHS